MVPEGPGGPDIFRFVQMPNEKELYFLRDYSKNDVFVNYGLEVEDEEFGSLNKNTFPSKNYAYGLKVSSLEYPGTIISPSGAQLKKEEDFPFNTEAIQYDNEKINENWYEGIFFKKDLLKLSFVDPVYGDVYTTDSTKMVEQNSGNIYAENGFYLKAPDGTFVIYSAVNNLGADIPNVVWNNGENNNLSYTSQGESGCGTASYADVILGLDESDLIILGKDHLGNSVYGFADKNNKMLREYYEADLKLAKDSDNALFGGKSFTSKTSYEEFLSLHPMFFWKDSFGRMVRFLNQEIMPLAECGKPVIYLYPKEKQNISVKVYPAGGMSVSDPAYNEGWNVVADSQRNILNLSDNKTYPYLFWEGSGKAIYHMPKMGFVIKKENIDNFFNDKLSQMGLITKEINDFKEFWLPRMLSENKPYYFVTFVDRATIDKLAPLEITPQPDTTIRVLMDYKSLDVPISARGFEIKTPQRNGFTAVEWGGVLR
ncbi:MAG: hypothetical protein UR99_C0058G0001 [Candidatus Moranbacteria bacterium GW2011_GWD2_36_12]|nr:MAG: hypothetical protein UR99_C0058G0001 [Candidatus Moranbacteria bacterium GW2011_GWD2_36_12]